MRVVIAGDSWGLGELAWNHTGFSILHRGLAQYLQDNGYSCANLSQGGASNSLIAKNLESYLSGFRGQNTYRSNDIILVFQTTYTRDFNYCHKDDFSNLPTANSLAQLWISRFYARLSQISQTYNLPVFLIGGVSDTLWLTDMQTLYPGVSVICQSMFNLIVNHDHRIDKPVLSWYCKPDMPCVQKLKKMLPAEQMHDLMTLIDRGNARETCVRHNSEFFFPDGVHPNRQGHLKLFEFLRSNLLEKIG